MIPHGSLLYEILARDPVWSAYAICDLEEPRFSQSEWRTAGDELLLIYRGLDPPLLFPMGCGPRLAGLLRSVEDERVWVNYTEQQEAAFRSVFDMSSECPYVRMGLDEFAPHRGSTVALGLEHLPALKVLYEDGAAPIFSASQLAAGYFRGIYVDGRLVAAAGVHVLNATYGVATIGNIFTASEFRRRGYAAACTSAVVDSLLADGFRTMALSVERENASALRVYERLGFRRHCVFTDARARRRSVRSESPTQGECSG